MNVNEANNILQNCKIAMNLSGYPIPLAMEIDGILFLLNRLNLDDYLAPFKKRYAELNTEPASNDEVSAVPNDEEPQTDAPIEKSADENTHTEDTDSKATQTDTSKASKTNQQTKKSIERVFLFFRLLECEKSAPNPVPDFEYMKELHKQLMGDFLPDAGQLREVNLKFMQSEHTAFPLLQNSCRSVIATLEKENFLRGMSKDEYAKKLTYFLREFIILHPFKAGNNIALQLFFRKLSKNAGFNFDLSRIVPLDYKQASEHAFLTDDISPLFELVYRSLVFAAPKKK